MCLFTGKLNYSVVANRSLCFSCVQISVCTHFFILGGIEKIVDSHDNKTDMKRKDNQN